VRARGEGAEGERGRRGGVSREYDEKETTMKRTRRREGRTRCDEARVRTVRWRSLVSWSGVRAG